MKLTNGARIGRSCPQSLTVSSGGLTKWYPSKVNNLYVGIFLDEFADLTPKMKEVASILRSKLRKWDVV